MHIPFNLNYFRLFISWPEYTESSFLASMETALLKMEQSSDDHLDSNIKDDEKIHEGHHEHEKNENKKTDNVQR